METCVDVVIVMDNMKFEFNKSTHTYTLDGKRLTGVTTVLNVISKPALIGWAANMAVDYIWDNLSAADKEENWLTVPITKLEEARKAHTKKKEAGAKAGTNIHLWIEEYIKDIYPKVPYDEVMDDQINEFLNWVKENDVKFLESEKIMYSEKMWLGGTCDAVAEIKGKKYVVDFKTQAKMWDRTPFLQTAAYRLMLEEMGEKDFAGSLVLLLPKGGKLEEHYSLDEETDKKGFLAALDLYRVLQTYKIK